MTSGIVSKHQVLRLAGRDRENFRPKEETSRKNKQKEPCVSEVSTVPSFPPQNLTPSNFTVSQLCFCSPSIRNQDSLLYTTRENPTAKSPDYGGMSLLCLTEEHSLRRAVGMRRARRRRKGETLVTEVSSNCCK